MNQGEEDQIRDTIQKKINQLRKDYDFLKEETKPMGLDSAIGRVSRMDYINNKSINEAQIRKIENKLKGLHNWLSKIGSSDFGKCIRCRNEININRLLFLPESNHCITCASRL